LNIENYYFFLPGVLLPLLLLLELLS
jgi:hypothetical protein